MRNPILLAILMECAVLAATVALLSIPLTAPFNYYAALALLTVIPGRGFPRLLFGRALSIAETMLFTVLISIGLTTASVFGLLVAGVRLDAGVLRTAVLAMAAISSGAAVVGLLLHRADTAIPMNVGNAAAFVVGVLVSTTIGVGIMNLL